MYHLLAQVDVSPEHRDELIHLWRDLAADSVRTEPGTLVFEFFQDEGNPPIASISTKRTRMQLPSRPTCRELSRNASVHGSCP